MSTDIIPAAATTPVPRSVDIQPIPVAQVVARMRSVEQIVSEVMVEGVHWGEVPGVPGEKMIDKPGIEILAATFQLALDYVVDTSTMPDGELRYIAKCRVLQQGSEAYLGSGMGECSTGETKYLWRKASKEEFEAAGEDRRRTKTKTYQDSGKTVETLQVRENNADKANTALKQACTRAARDAVLGVLGVRGMVLQGRARTQQRQGQQQQTRQPGPQPPTPAQLRKITTCAYQAEVSVDELARAIDGWYGVKETKDLTKAQASDLIERLIAEKERKAAAVASGADPDTGEMPDDDIGFDAGPPDEVAEP